MCSVRIQDAPPAGVAARAGALGRGPTGNEGPPAPGEGTLRRWGRTLWAIVRQRCPRCRKGRIFRGVFAMNDPCPVCGLLFQREEGYFLGAMYISFAASVAILSALFFTASALLPDWGSYLVALLTTVLYLPLTPALFRYSRVLWIYLDRLLDPHGALAGSYEKRRLKQLEGQEPCRPASYPGEYLG
jgi:uncharacterized protein (DUF983 family)